MWPIAHNILLHRSATVYPFTYRRTSCLHTALTIMNKASINVPTYVLLVKNVFKPNVWCVSTKLYIKTEFSFVRVCQVSSKVTILFLFLPEMSTAVLHPHKHVIVLDFSHSNRCAVVPHCCSQLQLHNDTWCWASSCAPWPTMYHIWLNVCQFSRQILNCGFFSCCWVLVSLEFFINCE